MGNVAAMLNPSVVFCRVPLFLRVSVLRVFEGGGGVSPCRHGNRVEHERKKRERKLYRFCECLFNRKNTL